MWKSIREKDLEGVKHALEEGADVSATLHGKDPFLTAACRMGHLEIVRLLIDKGADVNSVCHRKWSPLMCATVGSHHDIVDLLLDSGANVHYEHNGDTAYSLAVEGLEAQKKLMERLETRM